MDRSLVVFSRRVQRGATKTRLIPVLGEEGAAAFAAASLEDLLERLAAVEAARWIAWDRPSLPQDVHVDAACMGYLEDDQPTGDLGARMAALWERREGAVVFVGADVPTLPRALVVHAFDVLARGCDAVFAPAVDGGYVLAGFSTHPSPWFRDMPWGTPRVMGETLRRARQTVSRTEVLDPWYDVDDGPGLLLLRGHLSQLQETAHYPRRTAAVLAALDLDASSPRGVSP